jgi:hypothetical protein
LRPTKRIDQWDKSSRNMTVTSHFQVFLLAPCTPSCRDSWSQDQHGFTLHLLPTHIPHTDLRIWGPKTPGFRCIYRNTVRCSVASSELRDKS